MRSLAHATSSVARRLVVITALASFAAGSTAAPLAQAQGKAAAKALDPLSKLTGEAKAMYAAGKAAEGKRDWASAAQSYRKAHELSGHPRLVPLLAEAERHQGHSVEALRLLEGFLREHGAGVSGAELAAIEKSIDEARKGVATLTVSVKQRDASVLVDGREVGKSPMASPVPVDIGPHQITVKLKGYRDYVSQGLTVGASGYTLEVELEHPTLAESLTGDAKSEYEAGRMLFGDGDYGTALLKFRAAHEASRDPRLLWNMAVCEKNQRHYAKVLVLIERYLAEVGDLATDRDKAEARELINAVKAFVSQVKLTINQHGAQVFIDDEEVGKTPLEGPLLVDMGQRTLRVTKPGFDEHRQKLVLQGGQEHPIVVEMAPEVTEGRLVVVAAPTDVIHVDGQQVGTGQWEGKLPLGTHTVHVTGEGKRPRTSDVVVEKLGVRRLEVSLEAIPSSKAWLWIGGGAVLVAGLAVGGYFVFKPSTAERPSPTPGTMPPGTVQLPYRLGSFR